jgi:hypothetical protein
MNIVINCKVCGLSHVANRKNQIYCGSKCRQKGFRRNHRKLLKRECLFCGKIFETYRTDKFCCNNLCASNNWNRKKGIGQGYKVKICLSCFEIYKPTSPSQKYCKYCSPKFSHHSSRILGGLNIYHRSHIRLDKHVEPKLRLKILKRDKFTCQKCGVRLIGKYRRLLHIHHIKPLSFAHKSKYNNLVTLCFKCHQNLHVVLASKEIHIKNKNVYRALIYGG